MSSTIDWRKSAHISALSSFSPPLLPAATALRTTRTFTLTQGLHCESPNEAIGQQKFSSLEKPLVPRTSIQAAHVVMVHSVSQ